MRTSAWMGDACLAEAEIHWIKVFGFLGGFTSPSDGFS